MASGIPGPPRPLRDGLAQRPQAEATTRFVKEVAQAVRVHDPVLDGEDSGCLELDSLTPRGS
jgi:hypothetical protein